jgi:tol-pal system protein YbgF
MLALTGCAGAGQARPATASAADAESRAVQEMQRESAEQSRRIAELEARLGLLEQEARAWRETPSKPSETVRIGGRRSTASDDEAEPSEEPARRGRVPVVRLHEREPDLSAAEPLILPEPPSGMAPSLAVVPLPGVRASKALSAAGSAAPADALEQYRTALRALRDSHWDEALQGFNEFLSAFPNHELADQAIYWRGEAHYAQRHYREALIDFEAVVLRASGSTKTADALLKLGLCHRRLGDQVSAERYFRQLREQYPSSDAARIATRENPS